MKFQNQTPLLLGTIASIGLMGSSHGGSVNSAISSINGNTTSFTLNFADSDKSIVLNSDGTVKASGLISGGDIILGVIDIEKVQGVDGEAGFGGLSGNNELTGIYALSVDDVTGLGTLSDPIIIGASALTVDQISDAGLTSTLDSAVGFGGGSAMVALFEDASDNYQSTDLFVNQLVTASDGDFFQSFGGGFWDIQAVTADILDAGDASAAPTSTTIATVTFGLNVIETGTSFLSPISGGSGYDVTPGTGTANALLGGGGGPVNSDLSFAITATPSPTAAAFGCLGLAAVGMRRRRAVKG